jgi:exodeoxyribonuclease V alpha subunit
MSTSLLRRGTVVWPEAWRPIDRLLAQWVMAHGGSEALACWAGAISAAEGEGHVALALDEAARFGVKPESREALDDARWVGDGAAMTPFVRDGEARLYLWRYWQAERRVAAALAQLTAQALPATSGTLVGERLDDGALDALFGGSDDPREAGQREAVRRGANARLFVLTGGPGTGKTTTVLRMLLARQRAQGGALRVRVAAPTGKAAQRLVDALRAGQSRLTTTLASSEWADTLRAFEAPEASTVHRLLGYHPQRQQYLRDASNPIDADLVVIDEASMLDLETLDAVLAALPPQAALWLVGDAEQLSPVGPGSAFQDLVQVLEALTDGTPRPTDTPIVRLAHSFRAEPALDALNRALREGDTAALQAALAAAPELRHDAFADTAALDAALRDWAGSLAEESRFAPLPADADAARAAAAEALAALGHRQWLCATREGAFGSVAVNGRLDALLRRRGSERDGSAAGSHYAGRRVLITRNDPDTGLFNGDVGLVLADADGRLRVWFEGADGLRALPPGALPAHEPAFALTVHKSQGSEYAEVAVLLPHDPTHRVLSRELLYTAASRARRRVTLHAPKVVLEAGMARRLRRSGGLHIRLAEVLSTP